MKAGDLVKFHTIPLLKRRLGCLPIVEDSKWDNIGLVLEVRTDGNVQVLWPNEFGLDLADSRLLEIVND